MSRARGEIDRLASTFLSATLGARRDRVHRSVFSLVHSDQRVACTDPSSDWTFRNFPQTEQSALFRGRH